MYGKKERLCPAYVSKHNSNSEKQVTAWKGPKYGVVSGPYFPVFSPNIGKYGPEVTLYLDTFHTEIYSFNYSK